LEILEPDWDSNRSGILERMPVPERDLSNVGTGDTSIDEVPAGAAAGAPTSAGPAAGEGTNLLDLNDLLDTPAAAPVSAPSPSPVSGDLLDLLGNPAPTVAAAPSAPSGGVDLGLLDIFGGTAPPQAAAQFAPIVAFDKNNLRILFSLSREADGSGVVTASFRNGGDVPLTNFVFEAAVPKYITLKMQPASGTWLAPQSESVTQVMQVVNTTNGEKPLLMKLRIAYSLNGQDQQELGQVGNFPAGF